MVSSRPDSGKIGLISHQHGQYYTDSQQISRLARIIHDLEDTKSLFCYKHVAETVFAIAREAFACSTIARHSVCCSPIFSTSLWRSSLISVRAVPMAEPCC